MRPGPSALLLAAALLTTACQGAFASAPSSARPAQIRTQAIKAPAPAKAEPIGQLTVQQAQAYLVANPGVRFIDVRNPDEYAAGHAKGAALKPLPDLATWAGSFPKDQPLVVICRSGSRSMKACSALQERGFTRLINIQGGTLAWEAEKLPMDK